ncbi:hypothetical protein ACLOJK_027878, partial [Asimina triloba]
QELDHLWVMGPMAGQVPSRCPAARHHGPFGRCIDGGALHHGSFPPFHFVSLSRPMRPRARASPFRSPAAIVVISSALSPAGTTTHRRLGNLRLPLL